MTENTKVDFTALNIDFTGVRDIDTPLPAGIYGPAAVTDVKIGETNTGNQRITLRFTVQPEAPNNAGENFWHWITLSPKSMPYVKRDLHRLGIDASGVVEFSEELFLGRVVNLRVTIDEYNGVQRNKIKELLPLDQELSSAGSVF